MSSNWIGVSNVCLNEQIGKPQWKMVPLEVMVSYSSPHMEDIILILVSIDHVVITLTMTRQTSLISLPLLGSWSIHTIPLQRDVIVRSLAWPGYFMYYSDSYHDYGSIYSGHGEKNKDIAFGVP